MVTTAENEAARLKALHAHELLDTPGEPAFDQIAALAASVMGTRMAAISLVDRDRIWFKARIGIEPPELDRKVSFCTLAIEQVDPTVIADARHDPAFSDTKLVSGAFGLRFYAGVPLITRQGHALGALCVLDTEPHSVTQVQLDHLTRLAAITMSTMEQRHANRRTIAEMSSLMREKDAALARASGAAVQIRHASLHDPLTGLANRVAFETRLRQRMNTARDQPFALLFLDLDHLKLVNDTHGHETGDKLLGQVAARLRSNVPAADVVARLGGDEFSVIHDGRQGQDELMAFAETLRAELSLPYSVDALAVRVTISIGGARFPEDGGDAPGMMRNADRALYSAKRSGRNCTRLFDHADEAYQQDRFALEQDLRLALSTGQLRQVYQPIHDMQTGRIVGAEALARWHHPEQGEISPDVFVTLAEETGQIEALGLWALQAACREAASWPLPVQISVNFSPLQFRAPTLARQIGDVLASAALAPERLDVEVTERLLLDDADMVLDIMADLRRLGVHLTLDDFGTGHAGLSYVRKFQFDRLKIDKSFVDDLAAPGTRAIVDTVLQMSRKLDVETVAEGVESERQRDWLRRHGCGMAQGHLYSRPLSGGALAAQLLANAA